MRIVLGFTDAQIEEITNDLQNINNVIFSKENDLEKTDWYGQNVFYGTSERKKFYQFY